MNEKEERALILGTISDLDDAVFELEMKIDELTEQLEAKKQRLELWRKKLAALGGTPKTERPRRPKGANLRAIIACLETKLSGIAAADIQRETGLPWSSVQATLKRNPELFVYSDEKGFWRLRQIAATPDGTHAAAPDDLVEQELKKELEN